MSVVEDRPTRIHDALQAAVGSQRRSEQLSSRDHAEVSYFYLLQRQIGDTRACSEVGNYDRVVIQELLKEIAQTQQVDLNAKQRFKGAFSYLCPFGSSHNSSAVLCSSIAFPYAATHMDTYNSTRHPSPRRVPYSPYVSDSFSRHV